MEEEDADETTAQANITVLKHVLFVVMAVVQTISSLQSFLDDLAGDCDEPPPKRPRLPRRYFDPRKAYDVMQEKYVGPDAVNGREFTSIYRLNRSTVEHIIQNLQKKVPFFQTFRRDKFGRVGASVEQKVLLPLHALAHGVAPHSLCSMFSVSPTMARRCYRNFCTAMQDVFGDEFMRLPTAADLKRIVALHKREHAVDGMFGSLDCMHVRWKNCPVEWHGSFKGRYKSMSTIALEALSDYNLWFWHVNFGNPGALNDPNILQVSPLLERLTDRTFKRIEEESGVVPFHIDLCEEPFTKTFILVDGAYPSWARFIKTIQEPITPEQRRFSKWQEACRKDIERAFGVLQNRWKAVTNPIFSLGMERATHVTACCIILHNMGVAERIMGDIRLTYDPAKPKRGDVVEEEIMEAGPEVEREFAVDDRNFPLHAIRFIEERELFNEHESRRLQSALLADKGRHLVARER